MQLACRHRPLWGVCDPFLNFSTDYPNYVDNFKCAAGYDGPLCAYCASRYYRSLTDRCSSKSLLSRLYNFSRLHDHDGASCISRRCWAAFFRLVCSHVLLARTFWSSVVLSHSKLSHLDFAH